MKRSIFVKRIFCVLLAALFAAAFSFGQELKFDGYVNSGLGVMTTDAKDANGDKIDPVLMTYGVDAERNIGRFRLNGAYTNADKNAGVNFRFQVQGRGSFSTTSTSTTSSSGAHTHAENGDGGGTTSSNGAHTHSDTDTTRYPANAPSLAFGYGWVKPVEMLTVKAGLVDDSTWRTADYIYQDSLSEGAGVLVKVNPVTGLDLGAGGYVATYNSGSNNNFLGVNLDTGIAWNKVKYTVNATYTMDKVFRFMVSGRTWHETGGDAKFEYSGLLSEFRLLAVENLTAIVVFQMKNLERDEDQNRNPIPKDMNFYETFGYKFGNLGIGLNAAQYIRKLPDEMPATAKNDLCLWFNPWISYSLAEGKIVPRVDAVYFMGGNQDGDNYHRRAFAANYNKDASVINARPSVKFNIDSRASLEIGDSFYYSKSGVPDADAVIKNVFYTDVVVRF